MSYDNPGMSTNLQVTNMTSSIYSLTRLQIKKKCVGTKSHLIKFYFGKYPFKISKGAG